VLANDSAHIEKRFVFSFPMNNYLVIASILYTERSI